MSSPWPVPALALAVSGAGAALAFVAAHVVAELRLHPRAAHDLAPEVAPAVVGLDVGHLQGFAYPLGQTFADLMSLRIGAFAAAVVPSNS